MARFTPEFLDELKSRLRPSEVIGKDVKLTKRGNAWWGLSPFKPEKTPSFTVDDRRGSYHCFSTQNHGDIITFLIETQGLSFPEAVERLAADAGLVLPTESPAEAARAEKAQGLAEACAAAAKFFSAMLHRSDGRAALDYLRGRDVTNAQIEAFQIGFAPTGRHALKDYLLNKGFTDDVLVESGLLIKPEDGGASYDRFRNRIMFPILGTRDRVIAFGGRAMDHNARAKYLNSPETPLFHKGSVLYNITSARAAAAEDKQPLIVCEGYMDVIALWGAGLKRAVAPLGTALTEDQLALLWRASDEPVLCFDGDSAGLNAAYRSVDRALPLLKPGKSLSFVFLPQGQDPDDLIRSEGASAMSDALAASRPLVDVLWERETTTRDLDTPERRAALRSHMRELVKAIADKDVRGAYGDELRLRLDAQFRPPERSGASQNANPYRGGGQAGFGGGSRQGGYGQRGAGKGMGFRFAPPPRPTPGLKSPSQWVREASLVMAAINHPELIERHEAAFCGLDLADSGLQALLGEVLTAISTDPALDSAGLRSHLTKTGAAGTLERATHDPQLTKHRFLRPDTEIDEVEQGFANALAHHLFESTLKQEVARSASQIFTDGDSAWKAAAAAREEMINSSRHEADVDEGDSPRRFTDALEQMKKTVEKKFGR
ncbi:DNA primase [Hyphococcus sp.]|uniref:DNA primase n=1 Tax=Hyphococcus sp. TaxID=2038636 RepID=UPI00207E9844|nr:MAG: DNA primase [Marinicaulis sp.]